MKATTASMTFLAIAGSLAHAETVTLLPGANFSHETNLAYQSRDVTALPYQSSEALTGASGTNSGVYNLAPSQFNMTLRQSGLNTSFYGRSDGLFEFTVPEASSYSITTLFRTQGALDWTGFVDLVNETTGDTLYRTVRSGLNGANPDVLPAGVANTSAGSALGVLVPGQNYSLRYVLYSSMTGGGGGTMFGEPESPGGADPTRGSMPRPVFGSMGVDGTIGILFGPEGAVVVPLPPAAWGGLALFGAAVLPKAYRRLRRSQSNSSI